MGDTATQPNVKRQFIVHTRTYYADCPALAPDIVEEFLLFNGVDVEVVIEWNIRVAGSDRVAVPTIKMFQSDWKALTEWSDLFAEMAKASEVHPYRPVDLEALLLRMGFSDATPTKKPAQAAG